MAESIKIDISKENLDRALGLLNRVKDGDELEFRFGRKDNNFIPGLTRNEISVLKTYLRSQNFKPLELEETTVQYLVNDIRMIKKSGLPDSFMTKTKLDNADMEISSKTIPNSNRSIRLSLARETNVSAPQDIKVTYERKRKRESFVSQDNLYRIDITEIQGQSEIELEIEFLSTPKSNQLFIPVKHMLYGLALSMTKNEKEQIIRMFNKMVNEDNNPVKLNTKQTPKPVNLKRSHIKSLIDYSVTNKLNGLRRFLIITQNSVYLGYADELIKLYTSHELQNLKDTILDCEYYKDQVFVFDGLFVQNRDVRDLDLMSRLKYVSEYITKLPFKIQLKNFSPGQNICEETKEAIAKLEYEPQDLNDGLIFTSLSLPYMNWHVYKWKPRKELTIDFLVNKKGFRDGVYEYEIQSFDVKQKKMVIFRGTKNQPANPIVKSKMEYPNNLVLEMGYVDDHFEIKGVRPDKKGFPNAYHVALDVWEDIHFPISPQDLIDLVCSIPASIEKMRKYHNTIKRGLINKYVDQDKIVLDLGAGRGGDLSKYQSTGVKHIYAVEPNKENYTELLSRLNYYMKSRVSLIKTEAQNTNMIKNEMKEKANVVASFFSLTFFFRQSGDLDALIETIDSCLQNDGYLIGTTFDGKSLYDLLKGKDGMKTDLFTIKKEYQDTKNDQLKLGMKLLIDLGESTIVQQQEEYLVDFELLVNKLMDKDIYLIESEMFNPVNLSKDETVLSKLNRTFIFQKTQANKPDEKKDPEPKGYKKLNILTMDKTTSFANPMHPNLVRTGTISEGSCMFHSFLKAVYPKYTEMTQKERKEFIIKFRKSVAGTVKLEKWRQLNQGQLARTQVGNNLRTELVDAFVSKYKSKFFTESDIDQVLMNIETKKELTNLAIQEKLQITINQMMDLYRLKLDKQDRSEEDKKSGFDTMKTNLTKIINNTEIKAYNSFIADIKDCKKWAGQDAIDLVSEIFRINLFIINSDTRLPYITSCKYIKKDQKSVIILYLIDLHYESIGEHINNKFRRLFEPDDPLIQKLYKLTCEFPQDIPLIVKGEKTVEQVMNQ